MKTRRSDYLLFYSDEAIETQALWDTAKLIVLGLFIGLCLIPFVWPMP